MTDCGGEMVESPIEARLRSAFMGGGDGAYINVSFVALGDLLSTIDALRSRTDYMTRSVSDADDMRTRLARIDQKFESLNNAIDDIRAAMDVLTDRGEGLADLAHDIRKLTEVDSAEAQ